MGKVTGTTRGEAPVQRLRAAAYALTLLGLLAVTAAIALTDVQPSSAGALVPFLLVLGALAGAALAERRRPGGLAGDGLAVMALTTLAGVCAGGLCLLALRAGLPLADPAFRNADRLVGLDSLGWVRWSLGTPLLPALRTIYGLGLPLFILLALVQLLRGRQENVWRCLVIFCGALLTTAALSLLVPAKGIYSFADAGLIAQLPNNSGNYFWSTFERFHTGGPGAALGLGTLDGVVAFPSFHTVGALLTAALFRRERRLHIVAGLWAALVILSTVPIGGHYLVDLVGGAAVFVLWGRLADRWAHGPRLTAS